jgi:hypothetical protein
VQHLIVWYHVLKALRPEEGIVQIAVEAKAGNVDDLVIWRSSRPPEYWQVKASVDAKTPANEEWLLDRPTGKPSLLQRIHESWLSLTESGQVPEVVLATTKNVDSKDLVLMHKDRNGHLADALRLGEGALASARRDWADQLAVTEDDLIEFLRHVEFRTGTDEHGWRDKVRDMAGAVGVRAEDDAIAHGVQTVRDWVKDPRREFAPVELSQIIDERGLRARSKAGLLVVQALDPCPRAEDATVNLDWVDLFDGDDPRVRRRLRNPDDGPRLLEQLGDARRTLRSMNITAVEVDGHMRLPLWFAVGSQLGETAGFTLSKSCRSGMWSTADSPGPADERVTLQPPEPLSAVVGTPWVVTVSVSQDISEEVEAHAKEQLPDAARVHLRPVDEPSRTTLRNGADAIAFLLQVRSALRGLRIGHRPSAIHLFLAMPGACALFLGYLWDRMPDTVVYWDLGSPGAYEAAFLIRN